MLYISPENGVVRFSRLVPDSPYMYLFDHDDVFSLALRAIPQQVTTAEVSNLGSTTILMLCEYISPLNRNILFISGKYMMMSSLDSFQKLSLLHLPSLCLQSLVTQRQSDMS